MMISPTLAWFLAGIFFFAVELALPGFVLFFFGVGAWCTALVVYGTGLSLTGQLTVFLCATLASLVLLRRFLRNIFSGTVRREHDSVSVVPQSATGIVTEDIVPPAKGQIRFGGSYWRATADEQISKGTVVEIIEQQDLLARVRPAQTEEVDGHE